MTIIDDAFKGVAQLFSVKKVTAHTEAVAQRCFVKMVFLKFSQNSQESNCVRVSFNKVGTLEQAFSCEFCEIFKSSSF